MDLLLIICLLADPAECRSERIALSVEAMTPQQCMLGAQPAMAEWSASHPKYRIERWRCSPAGHGEVRA